MIKNECIHPFIVSYRKMNISFKIISGHRSDGSLLWSPDEDYLYFKKCERGGKIVYECYQTMLRKRKNIETLTPACTADVFVSDGVCKRRKKEHIQLFNDLQTRCAINETYLSLREQCQDLCMSIPAQKIFTRELSKLVLFHCYI